MRLAHVLIVAGGSGTRLGAALPKQYLDLAGQSVLRRSVSAFRDHPAIAGIHVVIDPRHRAAYETSLAGLDLPPPIAGGATRQDSVRNGLAALAPLAPDLVLIHDAARPFVARDAIDRLLAALAEAEAAILALPVVDSLKRGAGDYIDAAVDRRDLWRAQTPQGFRFAAIFAAHRRAADSNPTNAEGASDDAAIAAAAGLRIRLVPGDPDNLKITNAADLAWAERRLMGENRMEYRTGSGFDVHRLIPGDGVTLCGIRIAHDRRLEGHSDADVALHALTDAILGALGAGDIGQHFPPSDSRWRGADSARFLDRARELVRERKGAIVHCDLTLICEAPKIGPHRAAMIARLAEILRLAPDRISVKATTTEKLGFTGRNEGIAAQAIATIALPLA